jgi:Lysylphosphatidylglycerol synthase TM region
LASVLRNDPNRAQTGGVLAKLQPEPVENHIRPKARRWKKVAGSALAVTLAGLLVWLGGTPMLTAIAQASILPQLLALAMGIASYVVAAERWKTVTNYLAKREVAPTIVYLDIRVLTGAAGYLVPRELAEMGGRVAWLTRMRDVSLGAATLGIVVDRFGDFAIMAIGLLPALLYLSGVLPVSLAFAFAFVLLLLAAIFGATLTGSVARSVRFVFKAGTHPDPAIGSTGFGPVSEHAFQACRKPQTGIPGNDCRGQLLPRQHVRHLHRNDRRSRRHDH